MKETKKLKCFSKLKRVALTLFAVLCVGNLWAGYLTFEAQNFAVSEDGTITFNANLGYHGTDTDRYAQLTAVGYNANGEVAFQETKVIGEELTELKLEEDGEGDGCVTYPCTIANSGLSATENYKVKFHFWAVKADGSLSADYDITRYVFPPIGVTGITAKYGDLKFRIFGNIESGYNISAIKVNYILGTGTPNLVTDATIDAEAGTFLCEIPYTPTEYTLTYKITVEYADGTSKAYLDDINGTDTQVKTRLTADTTKVIYTWTGEGDGTSWTDELNWTVNSDVDTVGYPGTHDGSYYRTMITISEDVECIDLKGGTYGFVDDGAMYIAPNKTVKFKNGKFRFTSSEISRTTADASGASDELIGSNGGTLIFEKVYLRSCKDNGTESGNLAIVPRSGATIVFEGTYSDNWDYYPKSANTGTKIIIRNGELTVSRQLNTYASGSQNDVLISNAMWKVNNASSKTITPYKTLTFRDGPDRQAQIVNTGDLKLAGTYDFALPATPYSTPYYKLRKLSATTAGTIKVDVSNYKGGDLVPLIAFSGTLNDNTKTAMNTITTTASKLKVTANGVDVKATRNAKLVWNESKKTLYFQQDTQNAAEVAGAEYATFAEAFDAAQDGETVKLLNDVTLAEKLTVKKAVTLDLNGCTLSETVTDSYGAIYIGTAGNLTITDSATGGKIATDGGIVIGNYGTVTVAGGTIEAGAVAEEDASIYNFYYNGSTYGKLTVNGGKVVRIWNCGNANITAGEVVDIDNSGAMTIAEAATVSGTVIIKNGSDAAEVPGAGTLTAPESLTVQVGNDGAEAFYVDGKWLVQVFAATIGEAKFASFDAAIAAAQAGDTVKLYQDVKLSEILVINKAITLDGNGCTLTSTAARAINVSGVDGVTIKNLTISTSGERAINVIQGATNVTIENVTATAYNYTVNIASSAANAVVAINNSTLNGLCTVNVAAAGAKVTIDGSTVNCNDNNTTAGESYAALCLGKEAVGASIVATNTVVNVTEGSDSVKARNGAENGTITIDGSTDNVTEIVAVISYAGQASYYSFFTLEDAIDWATDADTITILKDIATDAAFEITKKVAINLNGKTIATTQADTEGNGVFWVKAGGELTLNGEGTVNGVGGNAYNIAIWADGGKVIINGGTYTNEGAQDDGPDGAHFDLIYVKNGGAVEINGGTFKCQTPEWTLNSHDTKKGTIVVNGGLFYQFNPSDCATEGAGTNWCAEGLKGAESAENAGYYEIVDAWTAPMPEKDGEADITEEYTSDVLAALEAAVATSVDVKVNGVELKGNEAVKALNTAVKCFDGALTFDGTAAIVDIVIEVVEVNTEDPAASTVVVKRGDTVLSVKTGITPTVKYIDLGSDAVVFKLVFE